MNFELSDQATRNIQAAIGTTDPGIIQQIIERMASDAQLVQSFAIRDLTEEELQESLAMCDRGVQDIEDGKTQLANDALREIAIKHGLNVNQ